MAYKDLCAAPGIVLPVPRAASGWHHHTVILLMKRKVPPTRRMLRLPCQSWRLTSDSSRSECAHSNLQVWPVWRFGPAEFPRCAEVSCTRRRWALAKQKLVKLCRPATTALTAH